MSVDYVMEHPSPMFEHQLMSRPCSQNSRMSVDLMPNTFNPSPAYRTQQQHPHMSVSQAKQSCLDHFNGASLSNIGGGSGSNSAGSLSRVPSVSSPDDFADIFSPLKYVEQSAFHRVIGPKEKKKHIQTDVSFSFGLAINRYVNMGEMSSPESLSPNRLNQALISETLSEFPHFEFVSVNTPVKSEALVGANTDSQDGMTVFENNKPGNSQCSTLD